MESSVNQVDVLVRREIEALIVKPILEAFVQVLGWERVARIVEPVIASLARKAGEDLKKAVGGDSLADLVAGMEPWSRGKALEIELLENRDDLLAYNVTRCAYVEMYRRLDMEDLGFLLSCGRDLHLIEGFNRQIKMERTKTIMQGHDCCDFRFIHTGRPDRDGPAGDDASKKE